MVAVASVGLEDRGVVLAELRARQLLEVAGHVLVDGGDGLGDLADTALELEGHGSLEVEEQEAAEIVALEEGVGVVNTASQVGDVDARVGTLAVDVTTEAEGLGIGDEVGDQVGDKASSAVQVLVRAAVPVLLVESERLVFI